MPNTLWIDTLVLEDVTNVSSNTTNLMASMTTIDTRLAGLTLLRTIIGVDIAYLVHDSGEGSQIVDIGLGISTQEAFAADVLPDPNTATEHPTLGWVFRARGRVFGFAADQPVVYVWRVDRDIRAKRILANGVSYAIWKNNNSEGATGTIRVTGLIRQLWLIT